MPEPIKYEDHDLFNPDTHHEHSDVPVRPLFWFIVIFIVFGAVSHVALYLLYQAFVKGERNRMDPPQTQVTRPASADVPQNQPLLQPFPGTEVVPYRQTPVTDLEDMRRAEDAVLHNYGWVDKQHGVVHIPIEEAKKLLAARMAAEGAGAPAASPATVTPTVTTPTVDTPAPGAPTPVTPTPVTPPVQTPAPGAPASLPAGPPASLPAASRAGGTQ